MTNFRTHIQPAVDPVSSSHSVSLCNGKLIFGVSYQDDRNLDLQEIWCKRAQANQLTICTDESHEAEETKRTSLHLISYFRILLLCLR